MKIEQYSDLSGLCSISVITVEIVSSTDTQLHAHDTKLQLSSTV